MYLIGKNILNKTYKEVFKKLLDEFKKPKFWDLKKPNYLAYLLLPLTILIKINIFITNLYQKKFNKIKSICVGNIYLGAQEKHLLH